MKTEKEKEEKKTVESNFVVVVVVVVAASERRRSPSWKFSVGFSRCIRRRVRSVEGTRRYSQSEGKSL